MIRYAWPSDDEQLAGQVADSHFDEDGGWWAGIQRSGAVVALATFFALTATSTTLATSVFSQVQDEPGLTATPLVYEEYWQNPVPPLNWPQTSVFTDDDVHPTFVSTFTPDYGDWKPLINPVAASNYVQLPFVEQDQTPQFAAVNPITDDAASVWSPQVTPWEPTWNLLFFLDDGSTVKVFQYDEDYWVSGVAPYTWPQPAQPFQASDDDSFVQSFAGNDEGVWTPQVPAVADNLRLQQQFVFEQNEEAANLRAFTDEVFWQNPTRPVPDSLYVLQQSSFDSQDPVGFLTLVLDDGFQPNFVPPVADSLRLLQQWPFGDFESTGSLYALHDEDYWINPVSPVNWTYPILPNLDEVIQTFVQTFQPDDDRWEQLVRPVVATNLYNQPFNLLGTQEDDTPVLIPFVPPPPIFCPLPPTGPDADIKMSTFGGTKPTLVLFCRICNSGKPLVVRADYAIWCQDCCAFVSKQDTYMGTVQAPGQFRSIF